MSDAPVNGQITDAVASLLTVLTGQAPAQSMGMLDAVLLETLGMAMHNAVARQQQAHTAGMAAVTAACARILAVRPVAPATPAVVPPSVQPLRGPDEVAPPGAPRAGLDEDQ